MKSAIKKIVLALAVMLFGVIGFTACNPTTGGKNTDNSFSMVATWTASGLVNHYNSNTNCNAFDYFVVEGLYRYVRSTDEIFCQLAGEMPVHTDAPIDSYREEMGEDAYEYYVSEGCDTILWTLIEERHQRKKISV